MYDYLTKPIQVEELVKALGKCQANIAKAQGRGGSGENEEIISSALPHRVFPLCTPASLEAKALQIIRDMAGEGAEEVLAQVIDAYLEDAPKLLQAIAGAIALKDAQTLHPSAHTLKSSSAMLGATHLGNLCKELEAIGRAGTIQDREPKLFQIEAEYERVKAALQIERQEVELSRKS